MLMNTFDFHRIFFTLCFFSPREAFRVLRDLVTLSQSSSNIITMTTKNRVRQRRTKFDGAKNDF